MRARHVNVLFVLTLLLGAGTLIQDLRFDVALARDRAAALAVERDVASIETALADWRAAGAGYVATGQGPSAWVKRAEDRSAEIETTLARLQTSSFNAEARAQYDAAGSAFGDLNGIDGRAREFAATDRRFEASDLIFTDAVGPVQRLSAALSAARDAERQAGEARFASTRWLRLGLNGVALACLVLAVGFFHRRSQQVQATADHAKEARETASSLEGVVSLARPAGANVNLTAAAELCVDLGRVIDGRDVPALFERLAPLLGAKGVVLWIADARGAMLRPSLTMGYSDRTIERLGALHTDSDNVTSLAFRSMRSQTVNGAAPTGPGAIAVPLVTGAGCVGVLSAEVTRTRPDNETIAVARMIAAQFAALVAPTEVESMPAVRTAQV